MQFVAGCLPPENNISFPPNSSIVGANSGKAGKTKTKHQRRSTFTAIKSTAQEIYQRNKKRKPKNKFLNEKNHRKPIKKKTQTEEEREEEIVRMKNFCIQVKRQQQKKQP